MLRTNSSFHNPLVSASCHPPLRPPSPTITGRRMPSFLTLSFQKHPLHQKSIGLSNETVRFPMQTSQSAAASTHGSSGTARKRSRRKWFFPSRLDKTPVDIALFSLLCLTLKAEGTELFIHYSECLASGCVGHLL